MLDPSLVDAISGLGALGFAVIAVWAFASRRIRTQREAEEIETKAEARLAEMRVDRDAWKGIAESMGAKVERLTDVVETLVGRKLP